MQINQLVSASKQSLNHNTRLTANYNIRANLSNSPKSHHVIINNHKSTRYYNPYICIHNGVNTANPPPTSPTPTCIKSYHSHCH
eukprot:gene13000-8846_t